MVLTDRQAAVLDFIREQSADKGFPPTVREIAQHFGIRSPNGVMCHLRALQKKGAIVREPGVSRAIRVSDAFFANLSGSVQPC